MKKPSPKRRARPRAAPAQSAKTTTKSPRKRTAQAAPRAAARPRRGRLSGAALVAHAQEVEHRLVALYPDAHCELDFRSPFELLCATILSAQCTDKRVNMVTPALFRRWPNARVLAAAASGEVEDVIRSTGFFRSKAKSLIGMAQALVASHAGDVPDVMDALTALPGVGRKTANVLLGNAFQKNEGIVVDTHVARLAGRLGFTAETDAVRIELALMPLFDRDGWARLSHLLIWHGRRVCDARKPRCADCSLANICPASTT